MKPWEGKHWIEHLEYAREIKDKLFLEKDEEIYKNYEHLSYVYDALLTAETFLKKDYEETKIDEFQVTDCMDGEYFAITGFVCDTAVERMYVNREYARKIAVKLLELLGEE